MNPIVFMLMMLVCWAPIASAEVMGRWTFNDVRAGKAADVSGNGNDAKLVNNPATVSTGKGASKGIELDEKKEQGADLGAQFHVSDQFSLEIWMKPTARPDYETIVLGKGSAVYGISYYKDGRAYFYVGGGANNISIDLMIDETVYLAATYDGTTMKLYANGELVAEKELAAKAPATDRSLVIGLPNPEDKGYFTGVIDEAAVYDNVLSADEISAHFKAGPSTAKSR